jgi:hypothetical protein
VRKAWQSVIAIGGAAAVVAAVLLARGNPARHLLARYAPAGTPVGGAGLPIPYSARAKMVVAGKSVHLLAGDLAGDGERGELFLRVEIEGYEGPRFKALSPRFVPPARDYDLLSEYLPPVPLSPLGESGHLFAEDRAGAVHYLARGGAGDVVGHALEIFDEAAGFPPLFVLSIYHLESGAPSPERLLRVIELAAGLPVEPSPPPPKEETP